MFIRFSFLGVLEKSESESGDLAKNEDPTVAHSGGSFMKICFGTECSSLRKSHVFFLQDKTS